MHNKRFVAYASSYTVTIPQPWSVTMIPFGKRPKKLLRRCWAKRKFTT